MPTIIFLLISILSFLGIAVIVTRKIAVISNIPVEGGANFAFRVFFLKYKNKISSVNKEQVQALSTRINQKFLRRLRIITLKVENILAKKLQKIKEREKKLGETQNGSAWEELKK